MLHQKRFTFNAFAENTYVIWNDAKQAILVDPGCYTASEQAQLGAFVQKQGLVVQKVLNTHCHIDHVLGNAWAKRTFGVPLFIHPLDESTLRSQPIFGPLWGFEQYEHAEADGWLSEEEPITLGTDTLQVLLVPGHSTGHVAFYAMAEQWVLGGDVLFYESVGRTDLPGGDFATLQKSIHTKLFTLPDETVVYPGHGPETTVGYEKRNNPYVGL